MKDLAERAIATFAQAYVASTVALPGDWWDLEALQVAAGAAVLAVLKGIAAKRKTESASLVD